MKRCTKCGQEKPLSEFFARKGARDGRMSSCKVCKCKMISAWRAKNRERWNAYVVQNNSLPHRREQRKEYYTREDVKRSARERERLPKARERKRLYLLNNPDKARCFDANRNARRRFRLQTSGAVTADQWKSIVQKHKSRCFYCGTKQKKLTMDHYIPISKGGEHSPSNIVPACHSCNSSKKALAPEQFALRRGRLCW